MISTTPKPIRARLRRLGQRFGVDIRRYAPDSSVAARRARLMANRHIGVVLDIGANSGQYGHDLRLAGYKGRIVSFEPLAEPFELLSRESDQDAGWQCLQLALGRDGGDATMHVAANRAASSSLLPMESWIATSAPEQAYVGTERVQVARLDDASRPLIGDSDGVMIKLDVQGYELEVMRGGEWTMQHADLIEVELSLVRLYEDQPLWREILDHLHDAGFELVSVDPFLHDDDGRLLQMDGIFSRSSRSKSLGT